MKFKVFLTLVLLSTVALGSCKLRKKNRCATCPTWSFVPSDLEDKVNS